MSDGNAVINLGDLAKPATVLIEKVSNAVGVLYEPRRIRKRAEAEADAEKIKALAGIELSEIQQRGIERLVQQEARKQENIGSLTSLINARTSPTKICSRFGLDCLRVKLQIQALIRKGLLISSQQWIEATLSFLQDSASSRGSWVNLLH